MRAAVLGYPISHSLSPTLHKRAYEILGIDANYDAVEVSAGQLPEFLKEVAKTNSTVWLGFSLTMPLKEEVLSVANEVDELAKQIRSANTLIPIANGWRATTTDVPGFIWALAANKVTNFKSVTIIGAGATARAAAAAVDAPGMEIKVINRNMDRIPAMKDAVKSSNLEFLDWDEVALDSDLVINTTPKGAADKLEVRLDSEAGVLFESLYDPWPTKLAAKWQGKVIDGLDLLVHQAIDQIALMTGKSINRADFAAELRKSGLLKLEK